ncbi:hypothetical protein [Streptomyces palmae]|uniref:hypothetical protein n=1 Tax=Streptomyces palmae TaxID=1701085 RepID=UPI001AE0B747
MRLIAEGFGPSRAGADGLPTVGNLASTDRLNGEPSGDLARGLDATRPVRTDSTGSPLQR